MATIDPVIVKIEADVADLKKGLQQAEASLKNLDNGVQKGNSSLKSFGDSVKKLGATIGVTFAASQVVSFFKQSVQAAQEAEAAQARLRNLLLNTNGATEAQIVALNNQAQALEKVGVVSANNITVAQSQLATFDLSAAAIGKLTPAILDYVTAEKGAAATSDDFKQMTNSLAQAMAGNFASLTKVGFVLDEATKKQISQGTEMERSKAIVEVLNSTYKDFNKNLRDTSAGAMQVAINDFNNLKQEIGKGLQPAVTKFAKFLTDTLFPALRNLMSFLKKNKDTIVDVSKVLAAGVTAFALYRTAMILTTNTMKVFQIVTTLMKGAQLASIASTNGLAASILVLNAAIKANPVGVIITAITLLVAALVIAYKKVDWFRDGVNKAFKFIVDGVQRFLDMLARLAEAATKIPGIGKKFEGVAKAIRSAADATKRFSDNIGKTTGPLGNYAMSTGSVSPTIDGGFGSGRADTGGVDSKTQSKIDALKKKLQGYYKDYRRIVAEANDKIAEAEERRDERIAEAHERYNEAKADAEARYAKREQELRKDNAKKILDITKSYDKKELEIKTQFAEKLADLQKSADAKRLDLRKSAAEKEASITQQSIDRLRSAFASALGLSLKDEFEKGGGPSGVIASLRAKLLDARKLQENAAALSGKGFSQTFIEQVVSAGPKAGNEMAQALLEATPESTKEMIDLFNELEKVSNSGLDALAATMNKGGKLATDELRKAYAQVAIDLQSSLNEVDTQLKEGMAEAQAAYNAAMAETASMRAEAIMEAADDLKEALAENDADLKEALADAQKALQKSLVDAQKDFEKAIESITKAMNKQLDSLMDKIQEVIAALAALGIVTTFKAPVSSVLTPSSSTDIKGPNIDAIEKQRIQQQLQKMDKAINVNITGINMQSPTATRDAVVSGIKYGQTVRVGGGL